MEVTTLIDNYLEGPQLLRKAVAGMPQEQLMARPISGKWSTLEVICHLADFEIVCGDRIKRVIAENEPTFSSGDPDLFAARLAYHDRIAEEELLLIETIRKQIGRILRTLKAESTFRLAAEQGIPAETINRLRAERDRMYVGFLQTEPCLIEGVEETLRSLHGRVRMGVVTSSRRQHFEIAHARTGLRKYLDFVLTLEDYRQAKPNPDPYLTAINRYRLQPDQCIVVEDSERGLAAATAAGLDCLIVRTEWSKDGDFSKACCIVDSVADVSEEVLRRAG